MKQQPKKLELSICNLTIVQIYSSKQYKTIEHLIQETA